MLEGKVKWFDKKKGYGFISCDQQQEDIFVHYTGLENGTIEQIHDGADVSFEIIQGEKGPKASKVAMK